MTCEPFCAACGGNLGHPSNGDDTCAKCKAAEALRNGPKERIAKEVFQRLGGFSNSQLFRLRTRGGSWRYYRKIDPMIYVGEGQYRLRSKCSAADIERAKALGSAVNVGKL